MAQSSRPPFEPIKGRGAVSNPPRRFQNIACVVEDDGWSAQVPRALEVSLLPDRARTIISRNQSPDVPFSQSINPYKGCEHGCIYCFARPTHAYLDLSPGLDFETRLFYKQDAADLLERELARPNYRCQVIALGSNTDPYQPVEKTLGITRQLLEVMLNYRQPVSIVTKSSLILRDRDLLSELARHGLVSVTVSITTLENDAKRSLEPRAAAPAARLRMVAALREAGVPVGVLAAPMIPCINDHELEAILEASAAAGARQAGYILLRLPHEVGQLFEDWLMTHYPDRARHVMSLLKASRNGEISDGRFGHRMEGEGVFADLLRQRFRLACRKWGFNREAWIATTDQFRVPGRAEQLGLF